MALTDVKSEQIQSSVALAGSPTTTTQSASDNSTKIATTAYVETAVANLVASAPSALNTLDELAAALNDDASFSTTITNSIATKLPLTGGTLTGDLDIKGGATPLGVYRTLAIASDTQSEIVLGSQDLSNNYVDAVKIRGLLKANKTDGELSFYTLTSSSLTERMRIDSSGNVGIGVTSPGAVLSLPAGESNTPRFAIESAVDDNDFTITQYEDGNGTYTMLGQNVKLNSGGNNTVLDSGHRTAGIVLDSRNHGAITFITGAANTATEHVKIDSSGNVGIGASNPSQKLHVVGKIKSTDDLIIGGANPRIDYDGGSSGALRFFSTSANLERMRITSAGNVGIGNSNPAAGKLVITASSNGGFGGNLILENSNASDTDKVAIALRPNGSATTALGSYGEIRIIGEYDSGSTNGASNLQFWTHSGNGTVAEAMRIGSTGHVAIGASPDLTKFIVEADHANWAGRFRNTNAGAYGLSVDLSQSSASGGQANVYAFATYTPANTGLVVTKNGSVGIRTATPGTRALNVNGNDNQIVIDGNSASANSGLFFAEQGTDKWEVYHRGADDTFRIYNYATSSPNLQISAGGAVTHEKQPFSQGRGSGGWTSQSSAANWTKHPLTTPSMRSNRGSHYSTTNKRFTAPVAGVYLIQASWYAYYPGGGDSAGSQYMHPVIYLNGAPNWNNSMTPYTIYGHDIFDTTSHYIAPTLSQSLYLSANDYVEIFVYSRDSDLDFYENYTYFAFQLIG